MTPEAYDLADALFSLAPWNWMSEDQLIAIRHPDTVFFSMTMDCLWL